MAGTRGRAGTYGIGGTQQHGIRAPPMISLLISGAVSFVLTILLTPVAIRVLRDRDIGQFIQEGG